jgi:ABC-type lipoprotein release transport system permease subunit
MIIQIAWRNIWRNPTRSLVVIFAMLIGMFAGVFMVSFSKGMMKQRLNTGIETEISHIQLHHPKFRDADEINYSIAGIIDKSDRILAIEGVDGASPRIVLQSMVASAETGTGVKLTGVYPEREKAASNLYTYLIDGKWFEGIKRNPVVIGKKLAERLNVKVRSKIVITTQDFEGNIISGAFRVSGIFKTVNSGFDEGNVFVRFDDISRLVGLPAGTGHEIAVHVNEQKILDEKKSEIMGLYPVLEVLNWKELNPEFGYISEVYDSYLYVFIIIILLALGFGIINTILMAVLERVKELGMLMAVGMKKSRVFKMIMWESSLMSLFGGLLGIVIALIVTVVTGKSGIDLSMYKEGYESLGYDSIIYPIIDWTLTINVAIMVFVTGIIAAIYPSLKALRLNPAEALRSE